MLCALLTLYLQDYVHRIGRTGRGGKQGASITFFTDEDKAHAGELMRILKDADQPVPDAMNKFPSSEYLPRVVDSLASY